MRVIRVSHERLHNHSDALDGTPIAEAGVPNFMNKQKLAFTLNKMLLGTGAGAAPTEVDSPAATTAFTISDTLRNANDTDRSTSSDIYIKVKEVKLNAALAACRLKFTIAMPDPGYTGYGQIYKNGVAIGAERTADGGNTITFTEDFAGWVLNDLIQIYAHSDGVSSFTIRLQRFCYSKSVTAFAADALVSPLLTTTNPTISMTNQDP